MTLEDLAKRLVADGVAPDVAVACAVRADPARAGAGETTHTVGTPSSVEARWRAEAAGATSLFFDLASLTKPFTAVAIAAAGINRGTPLGLLLPEAVGTPSATLPLELFLSHRAGLEANRALGPRVPARAADALYRAVALRMAAAARRPDAVGDPPRDGFAPIYSDLGYILAGEALARATGSRDAGDAIGRGVLEPLGLAGRMGARRELAAQGVSGPFAPTETVPSRGGAVVGFVHDENAWALTGEGGSGHAGLFGTVGAVLAFGTFVLDALDGLPLAPRLASFPDLQWLVRDRPGGALRAGFDGKSETGSSAGDRFGPRSFGHLGFTGTSLWIDPDAKIVVTLLTNRISLGRDNLAIRAARPFAHGVLFDRARALEKSGGSAGFAE
ncbi:MAG: beta-lactamase family protein [Myxococcota bacterium]|nr:beta-lactamase family protein [Myxococcota bacterium]